MIRIILSLFILTMGVGPAQAELITNQFTYESDNTPLQGYLVYDDSISGERPGILVVHEWWGHNAYARKRAEMLAELGYTALAIDMYGDGKQTEHPQDAGQFAAEAKANMTAFKNRFLAGLDELKKHPTVDQDHIAAIGYCFGGGTVLNMARAGVDLKGVVSFHGSLNPDVEAGKGAVKAKILVCHGGDDHFISDDVVEAFKKEMDRVEADYTFKTYLGAKHSFTNPKADTYTEKLGIAYNKEADEQSWDDMKQFFDRIFE